MLSTSADMSAAGLCSLGKQEETRASKAQRCFADDLESKRERALAAFNSYQSQPLDDCLMIAPETDDSRHRNMESWKS
jgi:hypothetical protein